MVGWCFRDSITEDCDLFWGQSLPAVMSKWLWWAKGKQVDDKSKVLNLDGNAINRSQRKELDYFLHRLCYKIVMSNLILFILYEQIVWSIRNTNKIYEKRQLRMKIWKSPAYEKYNCRQSKFNDSKA